MAGERWTRAETLAAFSLYCRLPFGKLHARNPDIVQLAAAIGRTPSSVAMKCCNLASLDETHQQRGVRGLEKAANLDRQVWYEFLADPAAVLHEATEAVSRWGLGPAQSSDYEESLPDVEGKERDAIVRVRINQRFFRQMILASYSVKCAVCEIPFHELLVASHIVPWSEDTKLRMNPRNGICLCGTHDLAFERGLLLIQTDYTLRIAERVSKASGIQSVRDWLGRYDRCKLFMPDRWTPDPAFLARRCSNPGI